MRREGKRAQEIERQRVMGRREMERGKRGKVGKRREGIRRKRER